MPKKKNVTRADGRIAVQVYLGVVDGKRKYKTVYGATQKDANEKALQVKLAMRKGINVMAERETFGGWSKRWIEIKKTQVKSGMMAVYNSCVKHLKSLENIPIRNLHTSDVQSILLKLSITNPNTNEPASKRLLECVKATAEQICQMAIENRVIDYNPVSAIKIPTTKPPQKRRALTKEERQWIIDTPHRAQLPAMIMMYAGLRRGEVIPLTWSDINLKAGTILVNKSVVMQNGQSIIKQGGKTENSARVIDIPQILIDFLKQQPKKIFLVCPSANGKMLNSIAWRRMWESYMIDLNIKYGDFSNCLKQPKSKYDPEGVPFVIKPFTAHCLRHTFATILYFAGVDILTAKEQLGHANVKTTLEIYTHLDKKFKRRSMDKLNDYIKNENDDASQMQVKPS